MSTTEESSKPTTEESAGGEETAENGNNVYLVPVMQSSRHSVRTPLSTDDDSNQFFMSEPSEGTSGGSRLRASQRMEMPRSFPNSPGGNTSLSSWDSPAMPSKKVLLQFPQPVRRLQVERNENGPTSVSVLPPASSTTEAQGISNMTMPILDDRLRRQPHTSSEDDSALNDETLNMTLSEDEDEEESTARKPPRQKHRRARSNSSHRRTRSGDSAAASIWMQGNTEWRGMHQDKIPLPEGGDDDETEVKHRHRRRSPPDAPNFRSTPYGPPPPSSMIDPRTYSYGSFGGTPPHWPTESQRAWMQHMSKLAPSPQHADLRTSFSSQASIPQCSEDDDNNAYSSESDTSANIRHNRLSISAAGGPALPSIEHPTYSQLAALEHRMEDQGFRGSYQNVMRHRLDSSPFANLGKGSSKAPRAEFMPSTLLVEHDPDRYPTYICPRCKTRQREFFSVLDAPNQFSGATGYLALYFALYVVASLFIFGLEEGWKPLDCIYFAVVTLTTAGSGDFVPTTDGNKIICSIFIYFGVACIGLLLGTYIAGILDEGAHRDRESKRIKSCPFCARIRTLKDKAAQAVNGDVDATCVLPSISGKSPLTPHYQTVRDVRPTDVKSSGGSKGHFSTTRNLSVSKLSDSDSSIDEKKAHLFGIDTPPSTSSRKSGSQKQRTSPGNQSLGSPVTRQILGRQKHTRHESFSAATKTDGKPQRKYSVDLGATPMPTDGSKTSSQENNMRRNLSKVSLQGMLYDESDFDDESVADSHLTDASTSDGLLDDQQARIKTAKYVFLTLRQALVNSLVIIAVGSIGFYFIENWSMVNSWYYTTVFLTTVGYGDIVPVTRGGKLFATIYILVGGTILLNNMSSISMIPLELRKRRLQQAVLTQFGDQLDDAALRELACGPVIQRLHLAVSNSNGLNECTREMFSLAMLVRMGKVSEDEIRQTFAAFRQLDVNDEGVLNSKSIIAAMIQKRKSERMAQEDSYRNMAPPPPPVGTTYWDQSYAYMPSPIHPTETNTESTALLNNKNVV